MTPLEHLAIAETALLHGTQSTATWVAIENIRRARAQLPPVPAAPIVHTVKQRGSLPAADPE
jgi:hypothetical protein